MSSPQELRLETDAALAASIEGSSNEAPVDTVLRTDDRVLARVTDGIYRQPGSAYVSLCQTPTTPMPAGLLSRRIVPGSARCLSRTTAWA